MVSHLAWFVPLCLLALSLYSGWKARTWYKTYAQFPDAAFEAPHYVTAAEYHERVESDERKYRAGAHCRNWRRACFLSAFGTFVSVLLILF